MPAPQYAAPAYQVQQQYAAAAPAYAPPQYPPPQQAPYAAPYTATPTAQQPYTQQPSYPPVAAPGPGPIPPNMHWAVVMILSWVTCGLAGLIWAFRQAGFAKKVDPSSKATMLMVLCLLGMLAQVGLYIFALASRSPELLMTMSIVILALNLVIIVAGISSIFSIRASLVGYYNSTENIGLRLSGVMTFFFSILYLQYHLSRIAEWKRTGILT